ncbi:MOSC beta barrel domain protein [Ancylostoma caninum]|uniref:MOSC beta barrel domain protein n=1 Tax=Ancylostoma caninum TaxID=29170 RepID=A0A368FFH0_ANCCA|nr:MOSC beta barrel domain protein [Ancylostoma caninum]
MWQDRRVLVSAGIGASALAYWVITRLRKSLSSSSSDLIPVGTVKELYVYPVKSCKGISVFSSYCDYLGPISGEHFDRYFVVIDGKTGRFYTARQKPVMVTIECKIADGVLTVKTRDGLSATVNIEKVRKNKVMRTAVLHSNLRTDGLDCGEEVAALFSEALGETDVRLLMYSEGLFTERTCVPHSDWWNNNVPKRRDDVRFDPCAYADLAPYMITTQASLDDLNSKLENDQFVSVERLAHSFIIVVISTPFI